MTIAVLTALIALYIFRTQENIFFTGVQNSVTRDTVSYPPVNSARSLDGRILLWSGQPVPLAPKNDKERIVVQNAILTIRNGHKQIMPEIEKWASDAKLVYARSLGSVSSDGKSSVWQYVFASKEKKLGREISIEGNVVASQKEVPASSLGHAIPNNWYDSSDAIIALQTLPQFSAATLSAISFYFNEDSQIWEYALVTSRGTVSMPVR